jgi:macrolide-specific efflux system membrane fusion protein
VPNPDRRLRISMTAQVTIVLDEAEDALIIPASALTTGPDGASVRVYDPASQAIERRPVTVGLNNNIDAEIIEGLAEGELIVTGGVSTNVAATGGGERMMGGPVMMRGPGG